TFSEAVQSSTISMVLKDAAGNVVPSTFAYDSNTLKGTLTPNASLATGVQYTVSVSGAADLAGNVMTTINWSFTSVGGSWVQTTAADFSAGTPTNTSVVGSPDGQLQLSSTM